MHHAVEQRQHRDRHQHQAERVEPRTVAVGRHAARRADRQVAPRQQQRRGAERHDDKENPAPAEPLDQHPTDARPDRRRQHDAETEDAHRAALLAGAEGTHDDDGGDGLQHTGCQAFGDTHREHQLERVRQAASHAAEHQQQHRTAVGVAVAEALEQPGRGQHRERHRRHEPGRQPLRALLAEGEDAAHVGHGDVDDGRGHDRSHRADHHRQQYAPAVVRAEALLERGAGVGAGVGHGRRRLIVPCHVWLRRAQRVAPRAAPARGGNAARR